MSDGNLKRGLNELVRLWNALEPQGWDWLWVGRSRIFFNEDVEDNKETISPVYGSQVNDNSSSSIRADSDRDEITASDLFSLRPPGKKRIMCRQLDQLFNILHGLLTKFALWTQTDSSASLCSDETPGVSPISLSIESSSVWLSRAQLAEILGQTDACETAYRIVLARSWDFYCARQLLKLYSKSLLLTEALVVCGSICDSVCILSSFNPTAFASSTSNFPDWLINDISTLVCKCGLESVSYMLHNLGSGIVVDKNGQSIDCGSKLCSRYRGHPCVELILNELKDVWKCFGT
eukprot:GHVL01041549.1.p1 GENE.GHVL01041549.1~~GHVL01041549.1.p1  ORF type:complete len:292 (+),score=40.35 GHVL01041549.1:72-947(+)